MVRVVEMVKPRGRSLPKELHEPPFHHEPEASWHVEKHGQEYEVKRHPLENKQKVINLCKGQWWL